MTAQKGKDLLLKVDSDGEGSFTTVAGLRARALAFNAATVDITNQESAGASCWKARGSRPRTSRAAASSGTPPRTRRSASISSPAGARLAGDRARGTVPDRHARIRRAA
jgi:hypothetical protein